MKLHVIACAVLVICFSALDFIWLGTVAFPFYEARIGALLLAEPEWSAAFSFYGLYLIGIYVFVIRAGLDRRSARIAALRGAGFGLFAYGTYDLTNMATLAGWSWAVVAVDMVWGMFATGLASAIAVLAACRLSSRPA
ncbi:DUF2177 family protein [Martelella sp. HB161492]|uniref:DUF2177 family protein n=1 Tax=Martelella sp. HB161492 TaxID=2720726 RepID=UPI0015900494|nr:DUF2177 family protein [Martelella sp. HB161492]